MANSPFQIDINGGAYLQVLQGALTIYTLGRLFHVDNTGVIVTAENYPLTPQVNIPLPYDEPINITDTGAITALVGGTWQPEGQIMAARFLNPSGLIDLGNGYYAASPASGVAQVGVPGSGGPFTNIKIFYLNPGTKKERPLAVLDVPGAIGDFILKAEMIVADMNNNVGGYFINIAPPLANVTTDINNLKTAEAFAQTHVPGSVANRNKFYDVVLRDLHLLQNYIQILVDDATDELTAVAIIAASGFGLKSHGVHTKADLEAAPGATSGTVLLTAKAVKDAGAYEWEMSADNINWTRLPTTLQATTTASGLTKGSTFFFHSRAVTKAGGTNWSGSVSIVVI